MTTRLLLVRHGRTAYNAEQRFMGQLDIPMDEKGEAQVQAVARRLATESPAAIYSSELLRARETAAAIQSAIASRPPLRVEPRLTEGHFGDWQGERYPDIHVQDADRLARWEADRVGVAPPNGEALRDIAERVQAAYRDICSAHRDQTVIIAAHGGSLQVLILLALDLPLEAYWKMDVSNASLSEVRVYDEGAVLHLLNDTSHLDGIE
jgi:broad specificity phosphatase PhoE